MKTYLIGGGGHATVVLDCAMQSGLEVHGVFCPDAPIWGSHGPAHQGSDAELERLDPNSVRLLNGVGGTRSTQKRRAIFEHWKKRGFSFATIIHPTAYVADSSVLGEGVQVMAGAVVQPGAQIGANSIVNTRASVDHHCLLGEHVHIAPGAVLSGEVNVGDGVHIGTGAAIIQGVKVGAKALVAAGAVVVADVATGAVVAGVPAKGKA